MSKLRDAALQSDDRPSELITVPEWGNNQFLARALTLGDRNDALFEARNAAAEGQSIDLNIYYCRILQLGTFDPEKPEELVFAHDDLGLLRQRGSQAIDRLAIPLMRLSGLSKPDGSDQSTEEAVEAAGKASSSTESDESSSQ